MVQIGDLAATLGQMGSDVGDMINHGLVFMMSDIPSFVNFASTCAWRGGTPCSLPKTVKVLDIL